MGLMNTLTIGGQTGVISLPYATCSTAAATAAKTCSFTNFSLTSGAHITVKFTYNNTASSPTLNVNSTGAKTIRWRGATLISSQYWAAGQVVNFVYDGTYWNVIGANAPYTLPTASSTTLGGVKIGSNITNSSGTISLTKGNVTSALGYTPPTANYEDNSDKTFHAVKTDNANNLYVYIPAYYVNPSDSNQGITVTSTSTVIGNVDEGNLCGVNALAFSLNKATSTTLGGIKIGYTENGNNYPVKLDANSKAYVNVPWVDTNIEAVLDDDGVLIFSSTNITDGDGVEY